MCRSNLVYDYTGELRKMFMTLGSKQGNEFVRSETQIAMFRQWWNSHKDGTMIKAEYKIFHGLKTNQQVKTHFGLLINNVIVKSNDDGIDTSMFLKLMVKDDLPSGVGLTKDFVHELLYALCPITDEEGKRVTLSKMTTDQACKWFDDCRNLLASRGIYIPDPDPNWKDKDNG